MTSTGIILISSGLLLHMIGDYFDYLNKKIIGKRMDNLQEQIEGLIRIVESHNEIFREHRKVIEILSERKVTYE